MKHELVQLQNLTGMRVVRRGNSMMLCGYYRGFATVTNLNSRARCYDVVIWASRPGADMAPQMNQWLAEYAQRNPACTGGNAANQMLVGHIAINKKRDITAQSLLAFYNDATGWLSANGMVSSCESCGSGESAIYNLGGRLHVICPRCLEEMTAQAKAEQTATPGNLPAGVVGALLFSLAGVALWVLVNRLGYVAAICGLVLMVCTFKGYEFFGKKMDMAGIVVCILVALFMGFVSQYICIGMDIYDAFRYDYDITLMDALRSVPNFMLDPDLGLISAYAPDLLMGYLFMALGSFSFVRNAIIAQRHGGCYVEKLADRAPGAVRS
jgi:hypothetical protein